LQNRFSPLKSLCRNYKKLSLHGIRCKHCVCHLIVVIYLKKSKLLVCSIKIL